MKNDHQEGQTPQRCPLKFYLLIALVSFFFNVYHNDFPVGYHFDEPKKVRFVLEYDQDFHHPILLLQAIRLPNLFLNLSEPEKVAVLGRVVVAIFGTGIALLTIQVAGSFLLPPFAAFAGLTVAVLPTIVIHSHYIKEDIPLTCLSLATILFFSRYVDLPTSQRALHAGLCWGLALSTHYKAILILGVMVLFWVFFEIRHTRNHLKNSAVFLFAGLSCFAIVNFVIFDQPQVFIDGLRHEGNHVRQGHFVPIWWRDFYGGYHLIYSILPGMTAPLGCVCVASFLFFTARIKKLGTMERLLVIFTIVFYLVPEISPLKPNPDECRYVLPIIPALVCFGCLALQQVAAWSWGPIRWRWCVVAACALLFSFPALVTSQLCSQLTNDTRKLASEYAEANGWILDYEPMAGVDINKTWGHALHASPIASSTTHFACSSFNYEVYFRAEEYSWQPDRVTFRRNRYRDLFKQKVKTFSPQYRSFAFSNPTLIIVKMPPPKYDGKIESSTGEGKH